ncbi:MAG: ABC transporter permease subunit [Chloroflexi bacterium CFX4]|nr:ABC transporter permease subunit [Chloroflexi bacterium CFX4]MDL1922356.1 ABC transporter permease subunit [Chloroflexi bacterium CFX3]
MDALRRKTVFATGQSSATYLGWADILILLGIATAVYLGVQLASSAPVSLARAEIDLNPQVLPYYALQSVGRMAAAYLLSVLFSLVYGYMAARSRSAERVLLPVLDVLQSVPILSFLPVVVLGLTAILPQATAVEIAAIVLIFTSQVWNMTYSFYQSLRTLPRELREAASVFRFNWWWRFRRMELPFASIGLLWNSIMSWAGGWFFLMAAEIFTVGDKDFRLPGVGSYLQEAANANDTTAIVWGVLTLVLIVVLLDQLVWRPLLVWVQKFKLETVEDDNPPTSWFYSLLSGSRLANWLNQVLVVNVVRAVDRRLGKARRFEPAELDRPLHWTQHAARFLALLIFILIVLALGIELVGLLLSVPLAEYGRIAAGTVATALRVITAMLIAIAWTIPLGVLIGSSPRLANILQPLVQIAASIPATAFFPLIVLAIVSNGVSLNVAAVLLMLLGTQWYILFNVIAGTSAIPKDLRDMSDLMRFKGWRRWRKLILPSLFPYLITGLITASGGAWNASIVAEYAEFGQQTYDVIGLGALISEATAKGDFGLLTAATLTMIIVVVCINRYFWRRLYRLAEEKYRME